MSLLARTRTADAVRQLGPSARRPSPCLGLRSGCLRPLRAKQAHRNLRSFTLRANQGSKEQATAARPVLGELSSKKLFSNLNPQTLKHEPGTVLGSALLVAGTTVGAGILALPAVTAEAGFLASSATLTACCAFSIATGLLVAEVNLNTMCEIGAGGVSLTTMAKRTLGSTGSHLASGAYIFLHYALLVAYISKAGEILSGLSGLPLVPSAALFAGAFGGLCYFSSSKQMDAINGGLVLLVVASFLGLLAVAAGGVHPEALATANWAAVPHTLPVVVLAFVYHNVVPVVATSLEGDVPKIRTAIISGVLIPYTMFVSWEGAILGSSQGLLGPPTSPAAVAASSSTSGVAEGAVAVAAAPAAAASSSTSSDTRRGLHEDSTWSSSSSSRGGGILFVARQVDDGGGGLPTTTSAALRNAESAFANGSSSSSSSASALLSPGSSSSSSREEVAGISTSSHWVDVAGADDAASTSSSSSSSSAAAPVDPLDVLTRSNPIVGPLIQGFSFLAIATSYIGFILGLTDFLADVLQLPTGRQAPLPYLVTLMPPFLFAVTNPDVFLRSVDVAGTYGVLTLFGILPAAMAWSERYGDSTVSKMEIVPGGRAVLLLVGGIASAIIVNEVVQTVAGV